MSTQTSKSPKGIGIPFAVRTILRGSGQVMFQNSAWTGVLFLAGIFWGAYAGGMPQVAWGAVVGLLASTIAGYLMNTNLQDGTDGLWGFNGILVGVAFPTFLSDTWQMWLALVFCAMMTTWMRRGFNNVYGKYKINSLTFPFVFLTWIFLLAARYMHGMEPAGMSMPSLVDASKGMVDMGFGDLVVYWLKGVSQVFLTDNWVTGVFFLVGLGVCNLWAAFYAGLASAIALGVSVVFGMDPSDITAGLMGFSPVLTGIALGCTFYKVNWQSFLWTLAGIVATVFVQAGMDAFFTPLGLPTLTGPFCIATWLFLLPAYKLDDRDNPDFSFWSNLRKAMNK